MIVFFIGVLLCGIGIPSFFMGTAHIGNILPTALGVICVLSFFLRKRIALFLGKKYERTKRVCKKALYMGCMVLIAGCALLEFGSKADPPQSEDGENQILLVLGAQVKGETPGLTLSLRLDAAKAYLDTHPKAMAVVSGGMGEGEDITEAKAMKRYLETRGIDPARILKEDASTSTRENVRNTLTLLEKEGMGDKDIILVSDTYHLFRARMLAKNLGEDVYTLSAKTHPMLEWPYRIRELFAIIKDFVVAPLFHIGV